MALYSVSVVTDEVDALLKRVRGALDSKKLMSLVDLAVRQEYLKEVFETEGFGKWPKTLRGGEILRGTSQPGLRGSFYGRVQENVVFIGNERPYFVTHELGLTLTPKKKYMAIPLPTLSEKQWERGGIWPRDLMGKTISVGRRTVPLTSVHEAKNGKLFVWRRTGRVIETTGSDGKKRKTLEEVPIFKLVDSVSIPKRSMLEVTPEMTMMIEDTVLDYIDALAEGSE